MSLWVPGCLNCTRICKKMDQSSKWMALVSEDPPFVRLSVEMFSSFWQHFHFGGKMRPRGGWEVPTGP